MRRTVLTLALGGTLAGLALPALAAPPVPKATVTNNEGAVGVQVSNSDNSPFAGAAVRKDGSDACVGISYQVPFCLNR